MPSFIQTIPTKTKRLSTIINNFPDLILYSLNEPSTNTYMTLKWEQAYLEWYATNKHSDRGEIVELGNKLKSIKRRGYGFRNLDNFSQRCLLT